MRFQVRTRVAGDRHLIAVSGGVDMSTVPQLRQHFVDALNTGSPHLVIDLTDVPFIDSTGLGVLVGLLKRVRTAGGSLRVVASHSAVLAPLRVTGLHRVFNVCSTIDEAMAGDEETLVTAVEEAAPLIP